MPPLVETLKAAVGTIFRDRDGNQRTLLLMPHLTDEEFRRLEASVPCPIPEEARVLLQYARGFQMPNLQKDPHRLLTEFDLRRFFPMPGQSPVMGAAISGCLT